MDNKVKSTKILSIEAKDSYNSNNLIGFFEGYKAFGDNTLSFGEVAIR